MLQKNTYHSWNKWWFDSSVQQFFPLDCPEKRLFLNIFGISFARPKSAVGILSQQLQWNQINYPALHWEKRDIPFSWWLWLPRWGIEDISLRHWRCCRKLPLRRPQGTETEQNTPRFSQIVFFFKGKVKLPRRRASRKWGRRGPTSRRRVCTTSQWALRGRGTRGCRRRCRCGRRSPCPPCTDQSRRFSRSPPCPAANCPVWDLCKIHNQNVI